MLPVMPFVVKLAFAGVMFKRLWMTDAFVSFAFMKNSRQDFGVRMWQLSALLALGVFLLAEMSLPASLAALSVSFIADTVVRKLSEMNGVVHGLFDPDDEC